MAPRLTPLRWVPQAPHEPAAWERVLFVAGLLLLGGLVVQTLVIGVVDPGLARVLAGAAVTEVFAGREGGVPVGLAQGAPRILVFQYSAIQDLGTAFLVYPLLLRLIHRSGAEDSFFLSRIRRIEAAAERHETERTTPQGQGCARCVVSVPLTVFPTCLPRQDTLLDQPRFESTAIERRT